MQFEYGHGLEFKFLEKLRHDFYLRGLGLDLDQTLVGLAMLLTLLCK